MQQEEAGQEIYTRDHGVVKVDKTSWMDGGFHIVLTPSGAYQHINGLPVQDEDQLVAAFGTNTEDLQKALDWFRHRHESILNPPRPIGFRSDNTPVFEDGSIPEESDIYNFFSPGPVLSAAIVGLYNYRQRKESGAAAPAPAPKQTAPAPPPAPKPANPDKPGPRAAAAAKRKSGKKRSTPAKASPAATG
jgi:hypothetical protein